MRWTERQRAMLREMGIELWSRAGADGNAEAAVGAEVAMRVEVAVRPEVVVGGIARREAEPFEAEPPGGTEWPAADWLVVGESLGAAGSEAEQLLDAMLAAVGVSRSAPARAGRALYVALAESPQPAAAEAGRRSLADTAALRLASGSVAPRSVLALGRGAALALLGRDEPLGSLRGQTHARGDAAVIVTFSLAYLLRHPADKAKAWADLCLAARTLDAAAAASHAS